MFKLNEVYRSDRMGLFKIQGFIAELMWEMIELSRKEGELGFSSVWIPAVLMRWSCLQPAQSVIAPAVMCALLGFTCSGRQRKKQQCLDSTCSFSGEELSSAYWYMYFFLFKAYRSLVTILPRPCRTHRFFPPVNYKYLTHLLPCAPLNINCHSIGICGRKWAAR